MIKKAFGLSGGGKGNAEVTRTRYTRYMQLVLNNTLDPGALDNAQAWLLDVVETDTEWVVFYNGANNQPIDYFGQEWDNNDATYMARKTKSNDVRTGWNKVLDVNGDPMPIFKPSFINERFDEWQAWTRTVLVEGGVWKNWWIGDSGFPPTTAYPPPFSYRVGYATSNDEGLTWTKYGTTPIYEDDEMAEGESGGGSQGIVVLRVVHDNENYKMIYAGTDPHLSGLFVAESSDGITGWTKTMSNLFQNQNYGFPSDFRWDGTYYWLWLQRHNMMPEGNLGPMREVVLFRSTDLVTWTNLGVQLKLHGAAQEYGVGNHVKALQKPNGEWFMLHTSYINRTQDIAGITKESTIAIRVAESNNSESFVMNSSCLFSWPDYVTFHAPLDWEGQFTEVISGTSGTLNSGTPAWAFERFFWKPSGSQVVTFANSGVINGGDFAIKLRVQTLTTGTHEIFRIGNDIILSIESGKFRCRLSSDGAGYEKDYITNVNISKPSGMNYIDDHIYVSMLWNGTTLRMWNDFVEFTSGQITKTVDDALTTVNNSGSNILIGQNATIELRSVSVCSEITATELVELDI